MNKYTMTKYGSKSSILPIIIVAAILLVGGVFQAVRYSHLKNVCTKTATGSVTHVRTIKTRSSKGGVRRKYVSTVSFSVDGTNYSFTLPSRATSDSYGKEYSVRYNPKNPNECYSPQRVNDGYTTAIFALGIAAIALIVKFVREKKFGKVDTEY